MFAILHAIELLDKTSQW